MTTHFHLPAWLKRLGRLPILLFALAFSAMVQAGKMPEVVVGFAQDTLGNDWRLAQVRGVEKALAEYPSIRFIYSDGQGSTAKQIRDIEDMLVAGIDILITSPRDGRAMTPVISRAYRSGIPVILLTRSIATEDYTTYISPDDAAIARKAAHFMAERLGGSGKILMLQGLPSTSTAMQRTNAFIEALEQYPELSVSAIKSANYLRSEAIKVVEESLQQDIVFDAIYAQSDSMASGARIALQQAGYDLGEILIVGIDYIQEAREAIRRGEQAASFTYPTCSEEAAQAVLSILQGKKPAKAIKVPSTRVTRGNVDKVEPIF